jgi:glucosamine-6-phosphate deaminase
MRLVITEDYSKVSEWAAKYIKKRVKQFGASADHYFTLGLPTGKSLASR